MDQELLQTVYRAVIIAKLMYASSALCGFTTAADRQRLESFLRRARCSGLYHTDRPTVGQLAEDADDTLFSSVTRFSNHLLHVLLPKHTNHPYHLRSRTHSLSLRYFIHLTAVFVLFCTLYFMLLCFFLFLSQFIYSCVLSSVFYTINVNDFLLAGNCMYSSVLYHFRVTRR